MIVASANGRRAMRRSLLVSTALSTVLLASVGTAIAGDLQISTAVTAPVSTSVGDGGGAGDINIVGGGSVKIDAADGHVAAVTLDSPTESISNVGSIVAGAGTVAENLGQNGILVTTATTGGLTLGNVKTGTTQIVDGTGAITTTGVGADAAVLVQASLGSGIKGGGSVSTIASTTNPYALLIQQSGAAITIDVVDSGTAALDYGIVNTGSIFSIGYLNGTPATAVGMIGSAGNAVNVAGLSNTGTIQATSNEDSATGIFVGDTATLGDGTHTGILNGSTGRIFSVVTAGTTSGVSTAIQVGANGTITDVVNSGLIQASSSGTVGGDAFGIDVDAAGSLAEITNNSTGVISAGAVAAGTNATAIRDQSGTLAQITNVGTIAASATATGSAVAIDLSSGAGTTTIDNSGVIRGEILFGGGTYTLNSTAGTISSAFTITAGGTADLNLTGTAILTGSSTLVGGGILNADFATGTKFIGTADDFNVSDVTFHSGSTFGVSYDPLGVAVPGVIAADNATLEDGAIVNVTLTNYLGAATPTLTLVTTTSSLNFDTPGDPSGLIIGGIGAGYNAVLATANAGADLEISLSRKTATQLGLSSNAAVIYDASIAALEADQPFGAAVGNIGTVAGVVGLYDQMLPDLSSARERQSIRVQDLASGMISDRMDMMRTAGQGAGDGGGKYYERYRRAGFWLQESASQETSDAASNGAQALDGTMYGLSGGYDSRDKDGDVWGASLTYAAMNYSAGTSISDNLVQSTVAQGYYSINRKSLFWDTIGSLGWNSYDSKRNVTAGTVLRTADATWTGYQAGVTSQIGFSGVFGPIVIRPSVGASYMFLSQEGYSESGGGTGVDLAVDSSTFSSLRANAQMRVSGIFGKEPQIVPYVRGGFSQELMESKPETNGHFISTGTTFALKGAELDKSTPFFGAGLSFVGGYSRLSVEYTGQLGSKFTSHQGVATASLMF